MPVGTVLVGLRFVAADDIAGATHHDLLDEELGLAAGALDQERCEGLLVLEHDRAHAPVAALAGAENVFQPPLLQRPDRRRRDHAPVRHHAHPADLEARPKPVHDGQQHRGVGRVAGQHLRAYRPALAINDDGQDHLLQVRPMVLRIAVGAERLAAGALEAQRGRVHEHHAEIAEEIAPALEQRLLDHILDAAWRQIARLDLLAQPGHGPVEAVKRQPLGAGDGVIRHPVCAGPVRARDHETVQHRDEHRELDIEAEAAPGQQVGHDRPAPGLPPEPSEQQRRADPAHLEARVALLDGAQNQGALGETTDRGDQPVQGA